MPDTLRYDIDGFVATVTLTSKTMPPSFFTELREVCGELDARDEVRCVIFRGGHEKAFTYGLDLPAAFAEHGNLFRGGELAVGRTRLHALIQKLQGDLDAVATLRVPTVAAVHGYCIGGGVDLISACDIRVCSADASFAVHETKIAIVADLGSLQRLPPIIGQGRTRELAFTGRRIDAARAEHIGLVNEVYADRDAMWAGARALADEIAANAPLTVAGVKQVLNHGDGKTIGEGLAYVAAYNSAFLPSEDLGEAVSAFMSKRTPAFKGR